MPSSAVTRLNKITYAGTAIGVGTNYHLHGAIQLSQDYTTLTLRWLVICHDTNVATFVTQCNALEAVMRTVNGDLKLEIGSSTVFDLEHSANTGMLAAGTIRKVGSSLDSNNTRLYSCSVSVQLPADEAGKAGRQTSKVSYISSGAEIVQLNVNAVYTALASNGALAQAKSAFPTYVTALQGVEGGTWDETSGIVYQHDSDDKFCQVSAAYAQVIANQSAGVINDTELQAVQISVMTRTTGPADATGSGARRMQEVTVMFSCVVRKSQSTDMKSIWETKVRPHMIAVAEDLSGVAKLTATDIQPGIDPMSNAISARMVFAGVKVNLISSDIATSVDEVLPVSFEPVLTGKPYDRDRHTKPGSRVATVSANILEVDSGNDRALAGYKAAIKVFERQGYHLIRLTTVFDRRSTLPGLDVTAPLRLRSRQLQAVLEYARVVGEGQRAHAAIQVR